jgi:uncharacterized protein YegL
MLTILTHQNRYLAAGQTRLQAVLSLSASEVGDLDRLPLDLAIVIDGSGSMEGPRISAARDGAARVIDALDPTTRFAVFLFSNRADRLFGPALATPEQRRAAGVALRRVRAGGGTAMSTGLHAVVDTFARQPGRATKLLLLTDGKNESEPRSALEHAVARCAAAGIAVHAWGVGTAWDEAELRFIADHTRGDADIIPQPEQIGAVFAAAFQSLQQTALHEVQLRLWSPVGVRLAAVQQVFPQLVALEATPDPQQPRIQQVALGAFTAGEPRDYLLDLELPAYPPGQQFVVARPSLRYRTAQAEAQEQQAERAAWVLAERSDDLALTGRIDPQVAHYTNQGALADQIRAGQDALAAGDLPRATRLLTEALQRSRASGNQPTTQLLEQLVTEGPGGTAVLNPQADAVARKTLAIKAGRTTKLR